MNSFHLDKICAKCLHINTGRVIVKPDIPDNPDNPDNPNNPDNPDNPDNPGGGSDIPDNPDIPPTVEEEEYTITLYTYGQTDGESSEFTIKVENGIITTPLPQPTR